MEPLGSAKLKSSQRRVMDGNSSPTLPCMAEGLSHHEEKSMTIPQTGGESETTRANMWGSPHSQAGSLLCKRAQRVANLPGHPLSREHEAWSAILVCRERATLWHSQNCRSPWGTCIGITQMSSNRKQAAVGCSAHLPAAKGKQRDLQGCSAQIYTSSATPHLPLC